MTIKIEPKDTTYQMNIGADTIVFALVSSPKEGRKQITQWFSCRDHINDVLIAAANEKSHSYYNPEKDPPFDYDRARILIAAKDEAKPWVFAAKKIINIYEDLAKFKKKSVIVTVKGLKVQSGNSTWLLTGPKEWMLCSQLTSMLTLIMRICFRLKTTKAPKDIDSLDAYWQKAITEFAEESARVRQENRWMPGSWDIESALKICYPKWRVLMTNFNKIFKDLTAEDLYPLSGVGKWHGPGGIFSLCQFGSNLTEVDKRFREICKETGAK